MQPSFHDESEMHLSGISVLWTGPRLCEDQCGTVPRETPWSSDKGEPPRRRRPETGPLVRLRLASLSAGLPVHLFSSIAIFYLVNSQTHTHKHTHTHTFRVDTTLKWVGGTMNFLRDTQKQDPASRRPYWSNKKQSFDFNLSTRSGSLKLCPSFYQHKNRPKPRGEGKRRGSHNEPSKKLFHSSSFS